MSGTYNQWGQMLSPPPQAPPVQPSNLLTNGQPNPMRPTAADPNPLSPSMQSLLGNAGGGGGDQSAALGQLYASLQAQGAMGNPTYDMWGKQQVPQQTQQQRPQMSPQMMQAVQSVAGMNWGSPAGQMAQGVNQAQDVLARAFGVPATGWQPQDVQGLLGGAASSGNKGGSQ
jgi:hypothetical protein